MPSLSQIRKIFNQWSLRGDAGIKETLWNSPPNVYDETVYLYRHFSLAVDRVDEYYVSVPQGENDFALFKFAKGGLAMQYLTAMSVGKAMVLRAVNDAAVSVTGAGWVAFTPQAEAWGGGYRYSLTVGDTMSSGNLQGTSLGLSWARASNGGFALVAVDSDYYNGANLLPVVTQADIDAGYFGQGNLGMRYIDGGKITGAIDFGHVVGIAEGLSDTNHVITIFVMGSKFPGAAAARVFITGFWAGRGATKPNDAGAVTVPLKWVQNAFPGALSSIVGLPSYTPTGFTNYQFMGEGHGNDAAVSTALTFDGGATAPAAGAHTTGKVFKLDRVSTLNHPNAAGAATRRTIHEFRADQPMAMKVRNRLEWVVAGTAGNQYMAMLPMYDVRGDNSNLRGFDRARMGDAVRILPNNKDNAVALLTQADTLTLLSTTHDFIATVRVRDPYASLLNYEKGSNNSSRMGLWYQDRSDGVGKFYFQRNGAGAADQLETILAGQVQEWVIEYNPRRLRGAYQRIKF